jgi:hypothetical protein
MSFRASTGESGLRVLPDLFKNRVLQLAEETVDSLQVRTRGAASHNRKVKVQQEVVTT